MLTLSSSAFDLFETSSFSPDVLVDNKDRWWFGSLADGVIMRFSPTVVLRGGSC